MNQTVKNIQETIKKLLYILDKKQKKKSIFVFVCIIFSAFGELLGISAIIPFIYALLDVEMLKGNVLISYFLSLFGITSDFGVIVLLGSALIVLYLVKNAYMLYASYVQQEYGTRVQKDLSTRLFKAYMNRPYTFYLDINSSVILRNINNDIQGVYAIIQNIFMLISEILLMGLLIIFFFIMDIYLAMGISLLSLLCFGTVIAIFKKKMRIMGIKQREARAARNKCINQSINGIKEIMVMQRCENAIDLFEDLSEEKRKADLVYGFAGCCPERIIEGVCVGGLIATVCIRIGMGVDVETFIPSLGAFAVAAFKILPSLSKVSRATSQITFLMPTLNETYDNIKESREYVKEKQIITCKEVKGKDIFNEKVEIKNIVWKYNNAKSEVLNNLSLTIQKGESIAFIGESGAGKTTLADIILGLLRPQQGEVTVDGTNIFSIPKEWSKVVGYVPQSVFLLDDTVRNNVSFGLGSGTVDDEQIWKALEQAQLKEFVQSLPKGLDTIVGERGVKFSGGQRQRISIARALYYEPEILVLDEATAALDNDTENAIMEAIDSLKGSKTLIIIAHRLTTIQNCNKIYEIVGGKAVLRDKSEVIA